VQFLHTRGPIAAALSHQILRSGTSAGANYEEADDGSSLRDSLAKKRIVLRELKETHFRLRVLRSVDILTAAHDPIINESAELIRIVAAIIRNASSGSS
jgi:four helix bundle protein